MCKTLIILMVFAIILAIVTFVTVAVLAEAVKEAHAFEEWADSCDNVSR